MEFRIQKRLRGFTWLVVVWLGAITTLWGLPIEHRSPAGDLRETTYGVFMWARSDKPAGMGGAETDRGGMTLTILVSLAASSWALFAWGRIMRNTTPRRICRHCGFDVSSVLRDSALCPECGHLPNEQKDPWAFWR